MDEITPLTLNAWLWIGLFAFWLVTAFFVYPSKLREGFLHSRLHVIPLYLGFFLIFNPLSSGPFHNKLYADKNLRYAGDGITFIGIAIAIWARVALGRYWSGNVTLKENHKLIRNGPYRITRHPLYTGFIIGIVGSAVAAAHVVAWIGAAIAIASLIYKLRREEKLLTGEFGEEYVQFKREVPSAVLPGIY